MKYFSVRQQWVLFVIALLLLGSLTFKFYYHPRPAPSGEPVNEVVVEVLGEVHQPGIYLYQNPPNLGEAIVRAGGLKGAAQFDPTLSSTILETGTLLTVTREPSRINRSSPSPFPLSTKEREKSEAPSVKERQQGIIHDEIKIRIGTMAANKLLVFSIPLDLNRVSVEDLCLTPGIGESLAKEIVAYRESRKGFRSVGELRNVRGIGSKSYETLKKFFAVKK